MSDQPTPPARKVHSVLVYRACHTSRAGKQRPIGSHIRGDLRDAQTGEVLYTQHKPSPFTRQNLERYCDDRGIQTQIKRNWQIVGRRWALDGKGQHV